MERRTAKTADHVISTNDSYRQIVLDRDGIAPGSVTVVRTGPDLTRLRRTAARAEPPTGQAPSGCLSGRDGASGWRGPRIGDGGSRRTSTRAPRHRLHPHRVGRLLRRSRRARADRLDLSEFVTFTGRVPDADVAAHPFHRRHWHLAGSQESVERCLDDEQDDGVHGLRTARRRVRPTRDPILGRRRRCLRNPERRRRAGTAAGRSDR